MELWPASEGWPVHPRLLCCLFLIAWDRFCLIAVRMDTEFQFTFIVDPKSSYNGLSYPRVEAANYLFVPEDDQQAVTPWDLLTFDENSGRLYFHLPSVEGTSKGGFDKKTQRRKFSIVSRGTR